MSSQVKWSGYTSKNFNIKQGDGKVESFLLACISHISMICHWSWKKEDYVLQLDWNTTTAPYVLMMMTCQSTDLELLSRFQVELYSKVSPRVAYGVQHQMPFDSLM
jgi:hypothetical protein